jgi:hypothetical protein
MSYADSVVLYILLALLIHFALLVPEPLPLLKKHPRLTLPLYLFAILGLVQFLLDRSINIFNVAVNDLAFPLMGVLLAAVLILKWGRQIRDFSALRWLAVACGIVIVGVFAAALLVPISPNQQLADGIITALTSVCSLPFGLVGFRKLMQYPHVSPTYSEEIILQGS